MKKNKIILPFLGVLMMCGCVSPLQDVSLNQIPENGEKVTYSEMKHSKKERKYDALSLEIKDSNYKVLQEASVFDPFFGTTETLTDKVDIDNINISLFQTNIKNTKDQDDIKASLNMSADIDINSAYYNKINTSIDIKSYIKNNTLYAEVNDDLANYLNKDSAGKYSFDLSEEDFSYDFQGYEIDSSLMTSKTSLENEIVYGYLSSKFATLTEVKVDVNGFPSVFDDDDTFIIGNSSQYDHGLIVYNKGTKVKLSEITSSMPSLNWYNISDDISGSTVSLNTTVTTSQIKGYVVAVKDKNGNYKDFYQEFESYKSIYDDSSVLINDFADTYFDIYKYDNEYLFNLDLNKETFKEKTNILFDKMVENDIYYFITGGKSLKLNEEIRSSLFEMLDLILISDFEIKVTVCVNQYGLTKLLLHFNYDYEKNYKEGRKECTYKNKININLNLNYSYYKRKGIKYPNFDEYISK